MFLIEYIITTQSRTMCFNVFVFHVVPNNKSTSLRNICQTFTYFFWWVLYVCVRLCVCVERWEPRWQPNAQMTDDGRSWRAHSYILLFCCCFCFFLYLIRQLDMNNYPNSIEWKWCSVIVTTNQHFFSYVLYQSLKPDLCWQTTNIFRISTKR